MVTIQQQAIHWRDRAIQKSEVISDAWQVFLAYTGRGAEIVLFLCMAISLIQMIPNISLPNALTGVVFVINMITLDVAGFGLNSLAEAVRRAGDEETAKKAKTVGTCLIIIMVVSLVSGGVDRLFGVKSHTVKEYVGYLDDILLLTRIVMTVFYGKIMHALRDSQQHMQAVVDETEVRLREEITRLQAMLKQERESSQTEQTRLATEMTTLKNEQAAMINDLQQQLSQAQSDLESKTAELSQTQGLLQNASQNESSVKAQTSEKELSWQAKMQVAVKAAKDEMQAQMKAQQQAEMQAMKAEQQAEMQALNAKLEALSRTNADLKAQLKEQVKGPVKQAKQVSQEKFDTRRFVFSCLQENAEMKLSEIVMKAKMQGQELSEPTISRYRKEYRESSNESSNESSAV